MSSSQHSRSFAVSFFPHYDDGDDDHHSTTESGTCSKRIAHFGKQPLLLFSFGISVFFYLCVAIDERASYHHQAAPLIWRLYDPVHLYTGGGVSGVKQRPVTWFTCPLGGSWLSKRPRVPSSFHCKMFANINVVFLSCQRKSHYCPL